MALFIVILQCKNKNMGVTKTDLFTDSQNKIATCLKAIGHPARVAILEYLISIDSCICGDIVDNIPLSQPTISQHLKELKNAELIIGNIEGNAICYCINKNTIEQLQTFFTDILQNLSKKDQQCC